MTDRRQHRRHTGGPLDNFQSDPTCPLKEKAIDAVKVRVLGVRTKLSVVDMRRAVPGEQHGRSLIDLRWKTATVSYATRPKSGKRLSWGSHSFCNTIIESGRQMADEIGQKDIIVPTQASILI